MGIRENYLPSSHCFVQLLFVSPILPLKRIEGLSRSYTLQSVKTSFEMHYELVTWQVSVSFVARWQVESRRKTIGLEAIAIVEISPV